MQSEYLQPGCGFLGTGKDHPAFASDDVLGHVEAKATEVTEGSGTATVVFGFDRMRAILDEDQAVLLCQGSDGIHFARPAGEVHWQDHTGTWRDAPGDFAGIYAQRARIDIGEDRSRTSMDDGVHRGAEGERCGDHLVARFESSGEQAEVKGGGTGVDRYRIPPANRGLELAFEPSYSRTGAKPAGTHGGDHLFDLGFLEEAGAPRIDQGRLVDTLTLAREGYPDLQNYKLDTLSSFFGVDLTQGHRALPDAEATANLLLRFAADLPGRIATAKSEISDAVRANRTSKDEAKTRLEAARRKARLSKNLWSLVYKKTCRTLALDEGIRMDGRGTTELRQISVEAGILPRAHGSGLFTRGETQVLTIATLGASSDVQRIDTISPKTEKKYIHHYNFPPYSTGENKPMRGPSRRDIGHGNLAERALIPVLPAHDDFPYVIRLVSECMSSNGSTSMASTCGSTLALMDAGVPISAPVAGAAMGLISEPDGRYVVLTDILGKEDSVGDMDFKVTGTRDGITALQMDIKVQGINEAIIRDGLKQALAARLEILDKMTEVLPEARGQMSDFAPRITTIKINPEKIREIIGKGGSMIRKIQEETSTEINVEDDGTVEIAAVSAENSRKAIQWIESLTREVEVGALYLGKVTRIMGFGAFVEILPGKEGLVRIGELADYHVPTVEDVVSVGDEIMVVVIEVDRQGRVNLSRKAAMQRHLAKEPV